MVVFLSISLTTLLSAQGCDQITYMLDYGGFLCGENDGQICISVSQDFNDQECATGYHWEITIDDPGSIITNRDQNVYIIQQATSSLPAIVGITPFLVWDVETSSCFDLSIFNSNAEITAEYVNDNDPTDRHSQQSITPRETNAVLGSSGNTTLLSSLIGNTLPLGGATGVYKRHFTVYSGFQNLVHQDESRSSG